MNQKQEELRKGVKYLKWCLNVPFSTIANDTGINIYTLYNFISGNKANLGYKKAQTLRHYLEVHNATEL